MIHLVPAAGPDFVSDDGSIKWEQSILDKTLIENTLLSRSWRNYNDKYIFILRDLPIIRKYAENLKSKFYNTHFVFLSNFTAGAADTILSGLGLVDPNEPICIDLADIIIEDQLDRVQISRCLLENEGLALTFEASDPRYSYLNFKNGRFIQAKEKEVISNSASAGVYFHRNRNTLLKAMTFTLDKKIYQYNNRNYVCPIFNGCHGVTQILVNKILDIK